VLSRVSVYNLFKYDKRSVRIKKFQFTSLCVRIDNRAIRTTTTTTTAQSIDQCQQTNDKQDSLGLINCVIFRIFWIPTSTEFQLLNNSFCWTVFGKVRLEINILLNIVRAIQVSHFYKHSHLD